MIMKKIKYNKNYILINVIIEMNRNENEYDMNLNS